MAERVVIRCNMLTAGHGSVAEEDVIHPRQTVVLQPFCHFVPPDPPVGKLACGAQRHVVLVRRVPQVAPEASGPGDDGAS